MGDRFDGALAASQGGIVSRICLPIALQNLTVKETLVTEDEAHQLILFQALLNPVNGGLMYLSRLANLDRTPLDDAIRNSQMTSMLKDNSRCLKYDRAISSLVSKRPGCRVLDIGTGTGLLAMVAARSGARHVDGVEMFTPLAELASRIVESNQLNSVVSVHPFRSTQLAVYLPQHAPPEIDPRLCLSERADILVTEIFDSALLGEACLPTIYHARTELLRPNAKIIPAKATVYARVVSSSLLSRFHDLGDDFPLHRCASSHECVGGLIPIPVHLDALEVGTDYEFVTDAFEVFEFDFEHDDFKSQATRQKTVELTRINPGIAHAVVMWWVLDLLGDGTITYSTKPDAENWQDHWLQMVYPLPTTSDKKDLNGTILLNIAHDDVSFQFSLNPIDADGTSSSCSCGFHAMPGGPYRIQDLSNLSRLERLSTRIFSAITASCKRGPQCGTLDHIDPVGMENIAESGGNDGNGAAEGVDSTDQSLSKSPRTAPKQRKKVRCLDVSDGAVCGVLATRHQEDVDVEVRCVEESDEISSFVYTQIAQRVKGQRATFDSEYEPLRAFVDRELMAKQANDSSWQPFDIFLSEPYTRTMSKYPLYVLANLVVQRRLARGILSENFIVVPKEAVIVAQLIKFQENTLESSFGRVGEVRRFDHSVFDDLFDNEDCCEVGRLFLPLFMYKTSAISAKTSLQTVHLTSVDDDTALERRRRTRLRANSDGVRADAVAVWVEYDDEEPGLTSRYEVLWLEESVKEGIKESGAIDVCSWWEKDSGEWKVVLEELSPSRRTSTLT